MTACPEQNPVFHIAINFTEHYTAADSKGTFNDMSCVAIVFLFIFFHENGCDFIRL